jgi:hypothetical protein
MWRMLCCVLCCLIAIPNSELCVKFVRLFNTEKQSGYLYPRYREELTNIYFALLSLHICEVCTIE